MYQQFHIASREVDSIHDATISTQLHEDARSEDGGDKLWPTGQVEMLSKEIRRPVAGT